ncbi:cupin domain-containing protein [Streptomyces sp. NPDC006872]|uniref:cupin domain-containing protein n=1 Tax=Streptomyces sp. NPDC006872 TaxID=3155720 RepID=UPI003406FDED
MRRIVTGHDQDGKSVVLSDGPPPRVSEFESLPGWRSVLHWATGPDLTGAESGQDSTPDVKSFLPEPGGTRFVVLTFPPDSAMASPDFDPVAFGREQLEKAPGIAEHMEPDSPGMHRTPTLDYAIVLDGEVTLELDDGALTPLTAGDVVIQSGTRHGWRNPGHRPATLAFVMIGTEQADTAC